MEIKRPYFTIQKIYDYACDCGKWFSVADDKINYPAKRTCPHCGAEKEFTCPFAPVRGDNFVQGMIGGGSHTEGPPYSAVIEISCVKGNGFCDCGRETHQKGDAIPLHTKLTEGLLRQDKHFLCGFPQKTIIKLYDEDQDGLAELIEVLGHIEGEATFNKLQSLLQKTEEY